jgi:hypothetical protein
MGAALAGVLVRVLLGVTAWSVHGVDAFITPDSATYLAVAASLAGTQTFTDAAGFPELFRTPGFPLVIAVGQWFGQPIWFALAAHLALTVLIVALVFHTAHRLTSSDLVATLCAWAVAVEPTMLIWSLKVLSETLFTACLVACVAAAIRAIDGDSRRWVIAAAVALAASIYVRPIAYPLILLFPLLLAWFGSGSLMVRLRRSAIFLIVCGVLLAPWHLRNWLVADYPAFSMVGERMLVISVAGAIDAHRQHRPFLEVRQGILDRLDIAGTTLGRPASAAIRRQAWETLAHDPLTYGRIHSEGVLRTLIDPAGVEYMRMVGRYPKVGGFQAMALDEGISAAVITLTRRYPATVITSSILALVSMLYLLGPVAACFRLTPRTRGPFVLMAVVATYLLIAGGGVPGNSRFRVPTIPLLVVMTACGWRRDGPLTILSPGLAPG